MSDLYSIVIKAKDGTVSVKAYDSDRTNIAIALHNKCASVFTDSLPDELIEFKDQPAELTQRVRSILNDNTLKVIIRPNVAVYLNEDGTYVFEQNGECATLDGDHPNLARRLAPNRTCAGSNKYVRRPAVARLYGKRK